MQFGSRRFQVVAAVLIVALLGGGFAYYTTVAPGGGGGTSTTSKSTQTTEITIPYTGATSTSKSTQTYQASTQSIVASTTLPCTSEAGSAGAPSTLPDYVPLFSTVRAMTMVVQEITVDRYGRLNTTTAVATFTVAAQQQEIGSSEAYVVNLNVATNATGYANVNGTSNSSAATAYFDQGGDLLLISEPNLNQTGSAAVTLAAPFLDWFNYELTSTQQLANYENPNSDNTLNQTAVTLGPTTMNVTYAEPKAIPSSVTQCGATTIVENVVFAYGLVPGTTTPIITYYYSQGTDGQTSVGFGYKVLSLTPG